MRERARATVPGTYSEGGNRGQSTYFHLLPSHLSLGLTFMAIASISASPHLSGPRRAATFIRRTCRQECSAGDYYARCGRGRQGKKGAFGVGIADCGMWSEKGAAGRRDCGFRIAECGLGNRNQVVSSLPCSYLLTFYSAGSVSCVVQEIWILVLDQVEDKFCRNDRIRTGVHQRFCFLCGLCDLCGKEDFNAWVKNPPYNFVFSSWPSRTSWLKTPVVS